MLGSEFLKDLDAVHGLSQQAGQFISNRVLEFPEDYHGQQILHGLKIPYLKMDIPQFDWRTMLDEGLALEDEAVFHRSESSRGWKSLCLHGLDVDKTCSCDRYGYNSEREAPYIWTWASEKAPVTTKYLKSLFEKWYFSELYRVRFMYLEPGGYINFHRDREEGRNSLGPLNIALNMPTQCHWMFEKWGFVPFQPGTGFAVDVSNKHGVWNQSDETRVHIIVHGRYGPAYYETLERSLKIMREQAKKDLAKGSFSQKPQKTPIEVEKKELKIGAVLWKQNLEIENSQLFSHCQNISEHFLRLKANRSNPIEMGYSLSSNLEKLHQLGCDWAFVVTPGTLLKDGVFKEIKSQLERQSPKTFLVAHLLDRKERWFGFHDQNFLVNLRLWKKLGSPPLSRMATEDVELVNVERSEDNIHDDYTPLFLKKKNSESLSIRPKVLGWNWIDRALRARYDVVNFSESVRSKKMFLYPEQNSMNLLNRLNQTPLALEDLKEKFPLSEYQDQVFDFLDMEYRGLENKMFLFNTEQVRPTYQQSHLKPLDVYVGLAAGFMDLHMLYRHKFHSQTELIYFDVNDKMLIFKEAFFKDWNGEDFPQFVREFMYKNSSLLNDQLMTTDDDEMEEKWERELKTWQRSEVFSEVFSSAKRLKQQYLHVNLLSTQKVLLKELSQYSNCHIGLWYSNCFNYTPGLVQSNWSMDLMRQKGVEFLNSLLNLAHQNNLEISVYGEEIDEGVKTKGFGEEIREIFL